MKHVEIAPGVYFKKEQGKLRVCIQEPEEGGSPSAELIAWDYDEICSNPEAWFSSLKAVSLATQHGPSVAKAWIEKKRQESDTPCGSLVCNICDKKFVVEVNHPFAFIAKLKGRNYHDYQCSEACNKKRYQQVYSEEMGSDFMNLWSKLKVLSID